MEKNEKEFRVIGFNVDSNRKVSIHLNSKKDETEGYILLDSEQISLLNSALKADAVLAEDMYNKFLVEAIKKEHGKEIDKIVKQMVEERKKNE